MQNMALTFGEYPTQVLIPYVDSKFRTIADRNTARWSVGLSIGGMQTFEVMFDRAESYDL
jgi:enterochelin esterase-like enzyme